MTLRGSLVEPRHGHQLQRLPSRLRLRFLALVGAAVVAVAGPMFPAPAAADACSVHCDATCQTCCPQWTIRAACSADTRDDGSYSTYVEALDAATHANDLASKCTDTGPTCSAAKMSCATGAQGVAQWQPVCLGAGLTPQNADLATHDLTEGRKLEDAAKVALEQAAANLSAFTQEHVLTKSGEASVATVAETIRTARGALDGTVRDGEGLRARGAGPGQALTDWRAQVDKSVQGANDANKAVEALRHDPAAVNAAADEKNRLAREAALALRARVSDLQKTAGAMKQQVGTSQQELTEILARPALSPAAHKRGDGLQHDLSMRGDSWTSLAAKEDEALAAETLSSAAVASLEAQTKTLSRQTATTVAAVTALGAPPGVNGGNANAAAVPPPPLSPAPKAPPPKAPVAAPAFVGVAPSIPTCTIAVVPAATGGNAKVSVSIDDGRALTLPADVKLASGRHTVVARNAGQTKKTSELVLCTHTKVLSIEVPR